MEGPWEELVGCESRLGCASSTSSSASKTNLPHVPPITPTVPRKEGTMSGAAKERASGDELEDYFDDDWEDDEARVEGETIDEMLWKKLSDDMNQTPPHLSVAEGELIYKNGSRQKGLEEVHRKRLYEYKTVHGRRPQGSSWILKKGKKGKKNNVKVYRKGGERGRVMKKKAARNVKSNKSKNIVSAALTAGSTLVEDDWRRRT